MYGRMLDKRKQPTREEMAAYCGGNSELFAALDEWLARMRLTDKQFETAYPRLRDYAREYIDRKYPCGDGGWIHYRVTDREQLADAETLLALKCL